MGNRFAVRRRCARQTGHITPDDSADDSVAAVDIHFRAKERTNRQTVQASIRWPYRVLEKNSV